MSHIFASVLGFITILSGLLLLLSPLYFQLVWPIYLGLYLYTIWNIFTLEYQYERCDAAPLIESEDDEDQEENIVE